MINIKTINEFGAKILFFKKGDYIYHENDRVWGYYQISTGKVKLNNYSNEGKEFIQNIFEDQQSFGEALLFVDEPYPTNAIAIENSEIFYISKEHFFQLLNSNAQAAIQVCQNLSQRLHYKILMSQSIHFKEPTPKIITLLDYFKFSKCPKNKNDLYEIPLTRQQIADLTGLRVETVIRNIKRLEKEKKLKIINHKIFY